MKDDLTPEEWVQWLSRRAEAERGQLDELNRYYNGEQQLSYLHPELLALMEDRLRALVINWPQLVVDTLDERLDVEGFRYADSEEMADDLWAIWQANAMDEQSQQGHIEALVMRRSFAVVGANEADPGMPLISFESPLQVTADYDPRTRQERAVLKRWNDIDPVTGMVRDQYATLYLPNVTYWYSRPTAGPTSWKLDDQDEHGLGTPPVVTFANRGRLLVPGGKSELDAVIPLSDAACKVATDMMVSSEFHAMPRRWALGFSEEDFTDEQGRPLSTWQQIAGAVWSSERTKQDGAEVGQFPEAQLTNFHQSIELLARLVASLGALPPDHMGMGTDDAASADAIRSREARLVKRAERRQRAWSGSYERMNRIALRVRDGDWDPRARQLETVWRDPSTPTFAQKADAVVKLHAAGLLPTAQAWEDLGYTKEQRRRMQRMLDDDLTRMTTADLHALSTMPTVGQTGEVPQETTPVGGPSRG
ncbi:phage portal protein [Streptomyces sp. NPDC049577]|uniref:phage portal protein n=1 Tax=Streptomyces sp. NPDC049577 TaxID=3155153 RepID=UPI00341B2F7C